MIQFNKVFLKPEDGSIYADITALLRERMKLDVRYRWTKEYKNAL